MWRVLRHAALGILAVGAVGCGGAPGGGDDDSKTRRQLSLVAAIYGDYLALHGNAPPAKEADLVATFADYQPRLKALKLPASQELLVSPRDGQPFLVAYSAQKFMSPWIAIERVGVEGKLLGVQGRGVIEELTPDQLPEPIRAALTPWLTPGLSYLPDLRHSYLASERQNARRRAS